MTSAANDIEAALAAAPATPAGRQAAWYLSRILAAGAGAGVADFDRYVPALAERLGVPVTQEGAVAGWRQLGERLGDLRSLTFEPASGHALAVRVEAAKDRRWALSLAVEEAPPHRICRLEWKREHDFDLVVREAGPDDWPLLGAIERRAPIVRGEDEIWFDRGQAWFDFSRLMEDATVGIAFVDGEPSAVTCGARHRVRIGGADKRIVTVSHLRVLPEHQRKGLWGAVNGVLEKYWPTVDGSNAFIAVGNAAMQHGFRNTPDKWPAPLLWARLDCARLAGSAAGAPARPAEAGAIAALLSAFHGGEEMFVPYTEESLAARLGRAPDLYSWDKVWVAPGAVLGVWPAGRAQRVVTERGGAASVSEAGVALDYAFAPGAEAAFETLVGAWCAHLAAAGMGTLSMFTSAASPGYEVVRWLAAGSLEEFNMWTPGIPVPPGAAERGLYIDPVYF
ncbi:MAG TPA: hypothetical protein VGS12_15785 [Caulobacteraceae bacterium]|nr:hypothetical protein [Caulobacteraceae bacterium]